MSTKEYKWPTLAEEGREMIHASTLIYGVALLRDCARKGLLTEGDPIVNDRILKLPATVDDVLVATAANKDNLMSHIGEKAGRMYSTSLQALGSNVEKGSGNQLLIFDDENSRSELVYGIGVNRMRKHITVCFRGSVTANDFLVDAKGFMCEVPNPLQPDSGVMGIHHGFHEYLYASNNSSREASRTDRNNNKNNKCQSILAQVMSLFEDYPNYRLYITGHSLGMALATLFATEAAACSDPRIPKPVSVIGIASPKVGNRAFLQVFQSLERQGLVRCLRIQNHRDAVTFLPHRGRGVHCISPDRNGFRHVGLEMTVYKNGRHRFAYPPVERGVFHHVFDFVYHFGRDLGVLVALPLSVGYSREFARNHSRQEYRERFEKFADRNGDVHLNDVRKTFVFGMP